MPKFARFTIAESRIEAPISAILSSTDAPELRAILERGERFDSIPNIELLASEVLALPHLRHSTIVNVIAGGAEHVEFTLSRSGNVLAAQGAVEGWCTVQYQSDNRQLTLFPAHNGLALRDIDNLLQPLSLSRTNLDWLESRAWRIVRTAVSGEARYELFEIAAGDGTGANFDLWFATERRRPVAISLRTGAPRHYFAAFFHYSQRDPNDLGIPNQIIRVWRVNDTIVLLNRKISHLGNDILPEELTIPIDSDTFLVDMRDGEPAVVGWDVKEWPIEVRALVYKSLESRSGPLRASAARLITREGRDGVRMGDYATVGAILLTLVALSIALGRVDRIRRSLLRHHHAQGRGLLAPMVIITAGVILAVSVSSTTSSEVDAGEADSAIRLIADLGSVNVRRSIEFEATYEPVQKIELATMGTPEAFGRTRDVTCRVNRNGSLLFTGRINLVDAPPGRHESLIRVPIGPSRVLELATSISLEIVPQVSPPICRVAASRDGWFQGALAYEYPLTASPADVPHHVTITGAGSGASPAYIVLPATAYADSVKFNVLVMGSIPSGATNRLVDLEIATVSGNARWNDSAVLVIRKATALLLCPGSLEMDLGTLPQSGLVAVRLDDMSIPQRVEVVPQDGLEVSSSYDALRGTLSLTIHGWTPQTHVARLDVVGDGGLRSQLTLIHRTTRGG